MRTTILKWATLTCFVLLIASNNVFSMCFFGAVFIFSCVICMVSAELDLRRLNYKQRNYKPFNEDNFE